MTNTEFVEVRLRGLSRFGWIKDTECSWIELDTKEGPNIRVIFPDDFPPEFKFRLQELQSHVSDERRKVGMPIVERVFDTAIDGWEYGYDPVNQAATITTRFQNGARQTTVFPKDEIPNTIKRLQHVLEEIEKMNKSQKH